MSIVFINGEINIGGAETEGFMYLITTDTDTPATDSASYYNTSIDSITEDSSKIGITGPSIVSLTITDGEIQYGTLALTDSANTTSAGLNDTQTIANAGNVNIDLEIKGQDTACPWFLTDGIGDNKYVHEFASDAIHFLPLTTTYQALTTGLIPADTFDVDLRLTMPDTSTCSDQQNVDVMIQASASP